MIYQCTPLKLHVNTPNDDFERSNMAILGIYVQFQGVKTLRLATLSKEYTCSYQDVFSFDYVLVQ